MNYEILINKENKIPNNLNPRLVEIKTKYKCKNTLFLEKMTYQNFLKLKEEALKNNYIIEIESAYRTHEYQQKLFDELVKEKGSEYAEKYIAKPYTSEHETGLAIDICIFRDNNYVIEHDLENLEEIKWLHNNCYKYGFILRYPKDKTNITKYNYEPWHIRYVGNDVALNLYKNNLTLEEYYDLKTTKKS